MSDPAALKKVGIFSDLSESEIDRIAAVCKEQSFAAGEIIIEEDSPGKALFVIKSGSARVAKIENGRERPIAEVGNGEHVGEMSLIDGMYTSARVIAIEPTQMIALMKEDFDKLLEVDDKLHIKFLRMITRTLAERLRRTSEDLMVWKVDLDQES